jgi:predicted transcriptional regulator
MENPQYIKELFNVLKNETRLHILKAITKSRYSLTNLQQELRKAGYTHSQETIGQEYLQPLLAVGLVTESFDEYYATHFGGRLGEVLGKFPEFAQVLPAHSECYEEVLLQGLSGSPKTLGEIETIVSSNVASRILKRLREVGLINTTEERDYIFFFRSKRDPEMESLLETQKKVYEGISSYGTSAGKLSKKTGLSTRRVYKLLRSLKGKKLVFVRKTPRTYSLTCKGETLASVLEGIHEIVEETWNSSQRVFHANENS